MECLCRSRAAYLNNGVKLTAAIHNHTLPAKALVSVSYLAGPAAAYAGGVRRTGIERIGVVLCQSNTGSTMIGSWSWPRDVVP
jgi:hypothetical protein